MKSLFWKAMVLLVITRSVAAPRICNAQSDESGHGAPVLASRVDPASPGGTGAASSESPDASGADPDPALRPVGPGELESAAIIKELEAMKARIAQLEAELKARSTAERASLPASTSTQTATEAAAALASARTDLLTSHEAVVTPRTRTAAGPSTGRPQLATASIAGDLTPALIPSGVTPAQAAAPAPGPAKEKAAPFSDWDWTWLNGNPRNKDEAYDSRFFTPEIRADTNYTYSFNKPIDDSMGGSSEIFRSNEIQLEQLGVGGDFHYENVRARLMTQFGEYSTATVRNDPSYAKGQWTLNDAYRYLAEAYGGYHINTLHGMNVDAGIFMSYIGLFSYYNFDNWAYQPSYVSSNTPWFFTGVRIQIFPTEHLKIEPWVINGWQSYASANSRKGLGGQIRYTPRSWLNIISNNYGLGHDDLYLPKRGRLHTDDSIEIKYYDHPENTLDKMAFSLTGDLGCEFGNGVSCHGDTAGGPKQSFIGFMLYDRTWFKKDLFGLTVGGGAINNPGRYLVLLPPINGETAASAAINSPYFTENPGDPFKAWDSSITFDYMPRQWITFRYEYDYRHANVPYWSGHGGITPPAFLGSAVGTNNGFPTEYACEDGTPSAVINGCGGHSGTWFPDLRRDENFVDFSLLVKF
jgi:hypothetical protein